MKSKERCRRVRSILRKQDGRCFYCGQQLGFEDASIDHLTPRAAGGSNRVDNLVVCCRPINSFLGSVSLAVKTRLVADSEFFRSLSRWCLVVDRNRVIELPLNNSPVAPRQDAG